MRLLAAHFPFISFSAFRLYSSSLVLCGLVRLFPLGLHGVRPNAETNFVFNWHSHFLALNRRSFLANWLRPWSLIMITAMNTRHSISVSAPTVAEIVSSQLGRPSRSMHCGFPWSRSRILFSDVSAGL